MSAWRCLDCEFGGSKLSLCRGEDGGHTFEVLADVLLEGIASGQSSDELHRAHDCLSEMVRTASESALAFLVVACARCPTVEALSVVAAGPLEDLLEAHGAVVIGRLETIAKVDPKFRLMLSGTWGKERIDPAVWARLVEAVSAGPVMDADARTPAAGLCDKLVTGDELAVLFRRVARPDVH